MFYNSTFHSCYMFRLYKTIIRKLYVVDSLSSWNMVLLNHITGYSNTLTQIHIGPQNSRSWPLCVSANVDIAAGNIDETYWQ